MTRFGRLLLLVGLLALGVRVAYVVFEKRGEEPMGDQIFYNAEANVLAHGDGFTDFRDGTETADHPPLTSLALVPTSWIGEAIKSDTNNKLAHRMTMAVFGTGVVLLIGLVGRKVAGERAGLIAALIGAVYPNLWVNDGAIMSETLATMSVALAILLAYRFWNEPTRRNVLLLGLVIGLAMLVRAELGLLLPIMVVPLIVRVAGRERRERWVLGALAFVVAGVVVAPWIAHNMARFDKPTYFSTNDGLTLCGANNEHVYYGSGTGLWALDCAFLDIPGDRSVVSDKLRQKAFDYVEDHLDRVPIVALARVGRVWNLYAPGQMADYSEDEGREAWVSWAGFATFWLLAPFAIYGYVVLRRRGVERWPLVAQLVIVTITAIFIYGLVRFRVPAEVSIVVFAGVAVDALLRGRAEPSEAVEPAQPSAMAASSSS